MKGRAATFIVFLVIFALTFMALPCGAVAGSIFGLNPAFWNDAPALIITVADSDGNEYSPETGPLSLHPGDEIKIAIPPNAFTDASGNPLDTGFTPSAAMLAEAGIFPKTRVEAGSQAFGGAVISDDGGLLSVSVRISGEFLYTRETDFDYYISLSGQGSSGLHEIRLYGKASNPVVMVYSDDEIVDLSGGRVAVSQSYIKNIQVSLGNGVSIYTSFFEGGRYYGKAVVDASLEDTPLVPDYPEVMYTVKLRTIGLKRSGRANVGIDLGERLYAYDSDGEYLGTTDKLLTFSPEYYLTSVKLEKMNL